MLKGGTAGVGMLSTISDEVWPSAWHGPHQKKRHHNPRCLSSAVFPELNPAFLLAQHGFIDMAEVPRLPVSAIPILHGNGVALLERGKLVRRQSKCHLVS